MTTVNYALIRIIQISVILFFAFVLAGFFGTLGLLPLAILYHLVNFLSHVIGFNGIFAFIIAVPAVGWVLFSGYKIPGFYQLIGCTGMKLVELAKEQISAFDTLARRTKGLPPRDTKQTEETPAS